MSSPNRTNVSSVVNPRMQIVEGSNNHPNSRGSNMMAFDGSSNPAGRLSQDYNIFVLSKHPFARAMNRVDLMSVGNMG